MDVIEAIQTRRTWSRFGDAVISREDIADLLAAAVRAPNHHLTEPWQFDVLAGEGRVALADAVAAEVGAESGAAKAARDKLTRAPVVIAVSQRRNGADEVADLEDYAACCAATQNLLLAAHEAGLAAKWSTGQLARYASAKAFLGLEPDDRIVGYVYLGAREEAAPAPSPRGETRVRWHE